MTGKQSGTQVRVAWQEGDEQKSERHQHRDDRLPNDDTLQTGKECQQFKEGRLEYGTEDRTLQDTKLYCRLRLL